MATETNGNDQDISEKLKGLQLPQRPENSVTGKIIYWVGVVFALTHIYFQHIRHLV